MRLLQPLLLASAAATSLPSSPRGLPAAITGHCWEAAFEILRKRHNDRPLVSHPPNPEDPCATFDDPDKKMIAVSMAYCHEASRGRATSIAPECDFERGPNYTEQTIAKCITTLNDFTFQLYMELYNHLEAVCFHIHAALWQQRAENLMTDLSTTADQVVNQLDQAHTQHEELIFGQQVALHHQQLLLSDSLKIQETIEGGHKALQEAFGDIQEEVTREHAQVRQIFSDLFDAFHRITQFHSFLRSQLFDLQTCLLYGFLVFLSHYMTTSPKTAAARVELYFLWTGMALVEFGILRAAPWLISFGNYGWPMFRILLGLYVQGVCGVATYGATKEWRWALWIESSRLCEYSYELQLKSADTISGVFTAFEDERLLAKLLISKLRWLCICCALYLYCRAYWRFQDPQKQALKSVTEHIDRLHTRLETRMLTATTQRADPLGRLLTENTPVSSPAAAQNRIRSGQERSTLRSWFFGGKKDSTNNVIPNPKRGKFKAALSADPQLRKWLADETQNEFMARVETNAMTSKYIMANEALHRQR